MEMITLRCFGTGDPLYERYHDEEWGRPITASPDERELLERLALEGFQSGLSWLTVLRKRPAFREVFHGFVPELVSEMNEHDVERLLADSRIIRNRRKIEATIHNARALLELHASGETLGALIEQHRPQEHRRPVSAAQPNTGCPEAAALAKELKRRGFTFVGPTTMYALMQAIGIVDDHAQDCWLISRAT